MRKGIVLFFLLFFINCSGNYTARDKLNFAVYSYNTNIRWGKFEKAKDFVANRFIIEHYKELLNKEDIRISEFDIVETKMTKEKAYVVVRINWYSLRTAQSYTTLLEQRWEEREGEWLLVEERVLDGKPL